MFSTFSSCFLVLYLVLQYTTAELQADIEFKQCIEKCTSTNTRERLQCKINCSEEMKKGYLRDWEKEVEVARRKREEAGEEIRVQKCTSQCSEEKEDRVNVAGDPEKAAELLEEDKEGGKIVMDLFEDGNIREEL